MEETKLKAVPGDYSEEQGEFLRAVGDHQARTKQSFLRATDYLKVMLDMGYSKNPTASAQN